MPKRNSSRQLNSRSGACQLSVLSFSTQRTKPSGSFRSLPIGGALSRRMSGVTSCLAFPSPSITGFFPNIFGFSLSSTTAVIRITGVTASQTEPRTPNIKGVLLRSEAAPATTPLVEQARIIQDARTLGATKSGRVPNRCQTSRLRTGPVITDRFRVCDGALSAAVAHEYMLNDPRLASWQR